MKIKPIFFILLFLIFAIAGCAKDSDKTAENTEENTEETAKKPSKSLNHNYHIDFGIVDFLLQ